MRLSENAESQFFAQCSVGTVHQTLIKFTQRALFACLFTGNLLHEVQKKDQENHEALPS